MENQKKETLSLPLRGIRILSIEQYGAAPFGSMFLADLGAEVIKIENPDVGGEMGRHVVPYSKENDSLFFQSSLEYNMQIICTFYPKTSCPIISFF